MKAHIDSYRFDEVIKMCQQGVIPDNEQCVYKVTPLVHACWHLKNHDRSGKNIESDWYNLIKTLLIHKSNPNHYGGNKGTPLTIIVTNSASYITGEFANKIIELLIEFGANVNLCPHTLINALSGSYPSPLVVMTLLKHNICQTNKNQAGLTPLQFLMKKVSHRRQAPNIMKIKQMLECGYKIYESELEAQRLETEKIRLTEELRRKSELEAQRLETEKIRLAEELRRKLELEELKRIDAEKTRLAEELRKKSELEELERIESEKNKLAEELRKKSELERIESEKNRLAEELRKKLELDTHQLTDNEVRLQLELNMKTEINNQLTMNISEMFNHIIKLAQTVDLLQQKCDNYEKLIELGTEEPQQV